MENERLIFEKFLKEKGMSDSTVSSYITDLKNFSEYLNIKNISNYENASSKDIDVYISSLIKSGKANSSVLRILATFRKFYKFLYDNMKIQYNPMDNVISVKSRKKVPSVLSSKEIETLLSQPDVSTPRGVRDKAILELLYATGIKVSELISLNVSDVNKYYGYIILNSKKESRIIPVYKKCLDILFLYMDNYRKDFMVKSDETALFLNSSGTSLTRQGIWKIIKKYSDTAKINKDITPHTLRHSFALHLLQNGADINDVSDMMGNKDAASVNVYTELLKNKYKDVYKKCHPRA